MPPKPFPMEVSNRIKCSKILTRCNRCNRWILCLQSHIGPKRRDPDHCLASRARSQYRRVGVSLACEMALIAIKLVHTALWTFFAGCILALPVTGLRRRFDWAAILTAVILVECFVLALNRGRCPLTDLAGRFTSQQADNFDIYLPLWLARYNKTIFGTLFIVNELIVLGCSRMKTRCARARQPEGSSRP